MLFNSQIVASCLKDSVSKKLDAKFNQVYLMGPLVNPIYLFCEKGMFPIIHFVGILPSMIFRT